MSRSVPRVDYATPFLLRKAKVSIPATMVGMRWGGGRVRERESQGSGEEEEEGRCVRREESSDWAPELVGFRIRPGRCQCMLSGVVDLSLGVSPKVRTLLASDP
jgi:hypothetical protein